MALENDCEHKTINKTFRIKSSLMVRWCTFHLIILLVALNIVVNTSRFKHTALILSSVVLFSFNSFFKKVLR